MDKCPRSEVSNPSRIQLIYYCLSGLGALKGFGEFRWLTLDAKLRSRAG